ncbi:type V toxin-antitoxin system endoribonuclease antitoxin GhoS [Siccibacter colletis]|uniref:type V toxin-antitoxin system endoribonuclease antitoxin GhoS n=1 Tax=Siccibacter colletis TaxID=1505757 RepID=UPI003CF78BE7
MSSDDIKRFVVTITGGDRSLTDINELTNAMTRGGFALTVADDDGKVHELGPLTFSILGTLDADEVKNLAEGLGESALDTRPDVEVTPLEQWFSENASR